MIIPSIQYRSLHPQEGDNYEYIMDEIDHCIKDKIKTLYVDRGVYNYSKPIFIKKFNGKTYEQFSLNIMAEPMGQFSDMTQEAVFAPQFNDTFAIGLQLARSCKISGLVIKGQGRGRDNQYSPYGGIVIDPICYQSIGTLMYPGLEQWYTGWQGSSGSSFIKIEECRIRGFEVGICLSPNSITLNAENIHVKDCCIEQVHIAHATTHRESKNNTVTNLTAWENVDIVFDGCTYGQQKGNMPKVIGGNIAGEVKQIINFGFQQFPTSMDDLFAESIHRVGDIESGAGRVFIRGCNFGFLDGIYPPSHFKGNKVIFEGCTARYYDDKFDKCFIVDGVNNEFRDSYTDMPILSKPKDLEENKRENYYKNHFCRGYIAEDKRMGQNELEKVQWLDIINIDVENKRMTGRDINKCEVGDFIHRGHPFFPMCRVMAVHDDYLEIDYINRELITNRYHAYSTRFKY